MGNAIQDRSGGAWRVTLIGVGFGAAWNLIGAFALAPAARPIALAAVAILGSGLALASIRYPKPGDGRLPPDRKLVLWSIVGEMAGIAAGVAYGVSANHGDLILPIVALAVGLHFLPLAKAFTNPVLMVVGTMTAFIAIISLFVPSPQRPPLIGFGSGVSFWSVIAVDLWKNRPRIVQQPG